MKRPLLLFVLLLLTKIASADTVMIDNICYELNSDDHTASVAVNQSLVSGKLVSNYSGDVVIPMTVIYNDETYTVTTISKEAFSGCSELTSIAIPKTLQVINEEAFKNCKKLKKVYLDDIAAWCNINLNNAFNQYANPFCNGAALYLNGEIVEDLIIPEGVTAINRSAFCVSSLKSVSIPSTVKSIGNHAFYCSKLSKVTFAEGLESIGVSAFANTNLVTVVLPNSCTTMDYSVFWDCSKLVAITLSENLEAIPSDAFKQCGWLTEITIPNSVKRIGENAFLDCSNLVTVKLPDNLKSIETKAFMRCYELRSIEIPGSVETFGDYIFSSCIGLKEAILDEGLTTVPYGCFENDSNLTSVTIPRSVTIIENGAFFNCRLLETFTVSDNVTSIYGGAFWGCKGLKKIILGRGLANMGSAIFGDCTSMSYLCCKAKTPPRLGSLFNEEVDTRLIKLLVPEESITDYKTAYVWNDIRFYSVEAIPTYPLIYKVDGQIYQIYEMMEADDIEAEPFPEKEGYTFSGWSEIPETMPDKAVTVTGTFTVNKYKLTYIVDGEEYKSYEVEYGSTITPEPAPTKEGCIFSGWSEIPEKMPAHDVTVTGTFETGFVPGDANGDGTVNVSDIVLTVNYIMGNPAPNFNKEAADLNGDGEINVTDIVMMVKIIMEASAREMEE